MKKNIILLLLVLILTACEEESIYTNKLYINQKIDEVFSRTVGKSRHYYISFQGQQVRVTKSIYEEISSLQKWDANVKFDIMVVSDYEADEKVAHLIPIK